MRPMLKQEKCLETLTQQNQQIIATQSTKRPSDDVAPAEAAVFDKKHNYFAEILTVSELTACNCEAHTAWQHVAANRENQQRKQQGNTGDNNLPTDIGITAKCALNAASKQPNTAPNVSSNITNPKTLLSQQSEPNVVCGKNLNIVNQSNSKHLTPFAQGKQCSKLFSNMLQQHSPLTLSEQKPKIHTNYARSLVEEQCAMISLAATNAKICQNTTTTTAATAKTKTANVIELFKASPPTPVQPSLNQKNKEKTIDFNSRRRRGRLRPPPAPPSPPPSTSPKHERITGGVGFHSDDYCLGRGVTATVCRALMWLASYLEKVAYNRTNAGYDQSDPLLYLLSVLLSLIVVNVNRVAIVVNEFKNEVNKNAITNTSEKNKITTNTTLTTASTNITNRETSEINKNRSVIKSVAKREENFVPVGQQLRCVCESAACDAERQEAVKAKNNNNLYAQNNIITPAATAAAEVQSNYEPNTIMTATPINSSDEPSLPAVGAASGIAVTPQQAANTGNTNNTTTTTIITTITTNITPTTTTINNRKTFASIPWRCRQMHLLFFYAFILCTSILLPCGNNLVSAAKPKSATQLQQQKQLLLQQQQQQQQQQQYEQHVHGQHGHQAHQPAAGPNGGFGTHGGYAGLGIPVAAGGPGADLTPPTYQVVSSQTSNEEAEFIFPSDQSDEQIFDQEEQNLNVVEMDEDDDDEAEDRQGRAYDVHNNGK
ncbi:unnamed protein product [Ceratitis capitata]|uniref:(Mediterranean fruit fly) hypothetical protein n=1 Tax=Ceratitis capitata TaxID=7213 RepID=A0A811UKA6_CERCA|nr:unnamed protein product [Ceratitis capitata]